MAHWEALKPGWKSAANSIGVIVLAAVTAVIWPWAGFAILAFHCFICAWLLGAQSAAIGEIKEAFDSLGMHQP
jgi:phosphotransferase system  glucose/maltose/N-acetylglucosamine-specific IIC component